MVIMGNVFNFINNTPWYRLFICLFILCVCVCAGATLGRSICNPADKMNQVGLIIFSYSHYRAHFHIFVVNDKMTALKINFLSLTPRQVTYLLP